MVTTHEPLHRAEVTSEQIVLEATEFLADMDAGKGVAISYVVHLIDKAYDPVVRSEAVRAYLSEFEEGEEIYG